MEHQRNPIRYLSIIICILLLSCTTTKLLSSWKDRSYKGGPVARVMVVGVSDKQNTRTMFEDLFAKEFEKNGVKTVSSIAVTPSGTELNKETIKKAAVERNIKSVFVTHLVGVKDKALYHPPPVGGYPHYSRFSDYYSSVYAYTHTPGYYTQHKLVRLESNLYDVESEKLIWSAQSETVDPGSINDVVKSLGGSVMRDLRKKGLIK